MRTSYKMMLFVLVVVSISIAALGQGAAQQDGAPVSVAVTILGKGRVAPPAIPQNEVVARQDGDVRRVISWIPASESGAGLDMILLVDDTLSSNVANRWGDLQEFLRSQPANIREGVAYASFGSARIDQELTEDHEKAAKALRIPSANAGENSAIYDAARKMIKKWPESKNRKAVIVISNGLDFSNGTGDTDPNRSISLQSLIEQAQQSGVAFYSIYARGAGDGQAGKSNLVSNGQGCLARLTKETGGDSFSAGLTTPVSFLPFLQSIGGMLRQQYILTFAAKTAGKGKYARLQIALENKNVDVVAPERVYVPGSK
jgi:VWFA-related protein